MSPQKAGAAEALRVLHLQFTVEPELREQLRVLRLYLKSAIFQPELQQPPRTTSVLKSCDFPAGAAGARSAHYVCTSKLLFSSRSCRGPGGNRTRTAGLRKQARTPQDNFQKPFRKQEYCTAPQRERFDTHDLRRGFIGLKTDARGDSESDPTRTIPAEGSLGSRQIRTAPQQARVEGPTCFAHHAFRNSAKGRRKQSVSFACGSRTGPGTQDPKWRSIGCTAFWPPCLAG